MLHSSSTQLSTSQTILHPNLSLDTTSKNDRFFSLVDSPGGSPSVNSGLLGPAQHKSLDRRSRSFDEIPSGQKEQGGSGSGLAGLGFLKRAFFGATKARNHTQSASVPNVDVHSIDKYGQSPQASEESSAESKRIWRRSLPLPLPMLSPRRDVLPDGIEVPKDYQLPVRLKDVVLYVFDKDGNSVRSVRLAFAELPSLPREFNLLMSEQGAGVGNVTLRQQLALSRRTKKLKVRTQQCTNDAVELAMKHNFKFSVDFRFFLDRPIGDGAAVLESKIKTVFKTHVFHTKLETRLQPSSTELSLKSPEYKAYQKSLGQMKVKISLRSSQGEKLFAISFVSAAG